MSGDAANSVKPKANNGALADEVPISKSETIASFGFTITISIIIILFGIAIAIVVHNYIANSIVASLSSLIIVGFFISIIFFLIKSKLADNRRKKTWSQLKERLKSDDYSNQSEYLIALVRFSLNEFTASTRWMFNSVRIFKYSTVLFSSLSTIILGLNFDVFKNVFNFDYSTVAKNIALVFSTLITAISTIAVFWNYEKYWLQTKVIKHQLRLLINDIEFAILKSPDRSLTDQDLSRFFQRHQMILRDFHLYWEGVLTQRDDKSEPQNNGNKTPVV